MQKTTKKAAKTSAPREKRLAPLANGVGRRKSSIARVLIRRGKGNITVNGKPFIEYFDTDVARQAAQLPFAVLPISANYDADANVIGGGMTAQADAVKLGIARAFAAYDETARPLLREHKLLTVDARRKERKKYGQKAARRKFQFVKR